MNVNDKLNSAGKMYGKVTYKMYDKDHNLVKTETATNNIVLGIRGPIIRLLGGFNTPQSQLPFIRQLRLGDGENVVPTEEDVGLKHPIQDSETYTNSTPVIVDDGNNPYVTFSFMYDANCPEIEGKNIHEMGLFAEYPYTTEGGTQETMRMVAHVNVGTWTKVPGLYFEVYWTIGYKSAED